LAPPIGISSSCLPAGIDESVNGPRTRRSVTRPGDGGGERGGGEQDRAHAAASFATAPARVTRARAELSPPARGVG
jgi:hypothetical protein